jgi:hypothetical protein
MKFTLHFLVESLLLLVALISGIAAFRKMNVFHKTIFLQLLVWMVFYAASYVVTTWQKNRDLPQNNHAVFNIHLLFETGILMAAVRNYFDVPWKKRLVIWILPAFMAVYVVQVYHTGLHQFANYADTTACFALTLLYALALYQAFHSGGSWWRTPEVYICAGILVYFACSIPYITAFGYLQSNFPELSRSLYYLVINGLNNERYLLLAIGFWLVRGGDHG